MKSVSIRNSLSNQFIISYAILRETARTGAPLSGSNLTALHGFLSMLHDHFPVMTVNGDDEVGLLSASPIHTLCAVRVTI